MVTIDEIEHILETYSLERILELNDLTEADALYSLVMSGEIELPNPKPVDFDD